MFLIFLSFYIFILYLSAHNKTSRISEPPYIVDIPGCLHNRWAVKETPGTVCIEHVLVLSVFVAQNPCNSRVLGLSKNFSKKQKNLKKVLAFFIHRLYIIRACLRQGRGRNMPKTAENTGF